MKRLIRICAILGALGLLAACKTTGQQSKLGVTSSVSTHIDLSDRSMTAYAEGRTKHGAKLITGKHGFKRAHGRVKLSCLKPEIVKILKQVERHYGKKVIVTSGYRSKSHNRRVRGARNSQHMYCRAADIRVPGVSKHALAKYARTIKGIGGVGVYCRSSFVHLDSAKRRDWRWGCGKKKRRKRAARRR